MLLTSILIVAIWSIFIRSVYLNFKNKSYSTYSQIIVCELCIVSILTVWAFQIGVLSNKIEGSVWILIIVGMISLVHKRLKAPKYKVLGNR